MDIKSPVICLAMITPGTLHPLPAPALSSVVVTLLCSIPVTITWPAVPGTHSISIVTSDVLDGAVTSVLIDHVLQASAEVMDDVVTLRKKMRGKWKDGEEHGDGGVRVGEELHANQLVLEIIVKL